MTPLGREISRAMTKARLTSPELSRRAGVGESWIRQLRSGRISRPAPDKLRRIAGELGLDPLALLAMTDQLGSSAGAGERDGPALADLYAKLDRQAEVIDRLAAAVESLVQAQPTPEDLIELIRSGLLGPVGAAGRGDVARQT